MSYRSPFSTVVIKCKSLFFFQKLDEVSPDLQRLINSVRSQELKEDEIVLFSGLTHRKCGPATDGSQVREILARLFIYSRNAQLLQTEVNHCVVFIFFCNLQSKAIMYQYAFRTSTLCVTHLRTKLSSGVLSPLTRLSSSSGLPPGFVDSGCVCSQSRARERMSHRFTKQDPGGCSFKAHSLVMSPAACIVNIS